MEAWRLLDTGPRPAAENVALDETLLAARARGEAPNTLRFLRYEPDAALVGFNQSVDLEVRRGYCEENGIDVNRRVTGGGSIFFDGSQLGWELVAPKGGAFPGDVEELYEAICTGAVRGLRKLGIDAAYRPKNDIEVDGRKISGTGGTLEGDVFLFQGTLLMDFDVETMLRALRIPTEKLKDKEVEDVKERVTCLRAELDEVPPLPEVKTALAEGFAEEFGFRFEEGELSRREREMFRERLPKFRSEEWVDGVQRSPDQRATLTGAKKAPGGLVRAQAVMDAAAERMHFLTLTGDFFCFPKRAVMDLEARFKNSYVDDLDVRGVVERFFEENDVQVPGVEPRDFADAVEKAVRKAELHREHGLPLEDANRVFTVAGEFGDVEEPAALLLPYCAKSKNCGYRYEDDCDPCGNCTVGNAYELAHRHGLDPVSINDYEHLEETLRGLKESGVDGFVGACCESFYIKHQRDFERIGLEGVLVDIDDTTCYDLGRVEEAKAGEFEEETTLKLDLLERVVEMKTGRGAPEVPG